ncbi:MAG: SnoaL-like domain-containing protein [Thermoactinospora sp.]|nr:SnoaL-like domain-containing protein [Thermoactinospora sp.]
MSQVWPVITAMYDAYARGDRAGVDALLHPECTIFDSASPELITSRAQLEAVRDARPASGPASGPAETGVTPGEPVIQEWADTAVAAYVLRVDFAHGEPELVRTSAVLRRDQGRWLIAHVHENTI